MRLENIRELIENNKIEKALKEILQQVQDTPFHHAFLLLQTEHKNWKEEYHMGVAPDRAYRLRIQRSILIFLTDLEQHNGNFSKKKEVLAEKEIEIFKKLEYLLTLDKRHRLDKIKQELGEKYIQLEKISTYKQKLHNIKNHYPKQEEKVNQMLSSIDESVLKFLNTLDENQFDIGDLGYFKSLVMNEYPYLADWKKEQNHKKANIQLLMTGIETLERQYEKLKTASFFGLLGYSFAKLFNGDKEVSIYGKGYNDEGYDENGYDFNGYDKDGYNNKGYNEEGFNELGLDEGSDTLELEPDTDIMSFLDLDFF